MSEKILIIDFGSQVTQLIARRLREANIYCEIMAYDKAADEVRDFAPRGVILSGGPASVGDVESPRACQAIFELEVPILGICYGQLTLCSQLGGSVESADHREFGRATIDIVHDCALFEGVWASGSQDEVWMSHGDRVTRLPEGFRTVAKSNSSPFAVIADDDRRYYGLMFHPEVIHTPRGSELLVNFCRNIVGCKGNWTMAAFRSQAIKRIRDKVGSEKVICGLSGGVDSSVAAVLIHEAIGSQLQCIYVDHGLMRAEETEQVLNVFGRHFNIPLIHRDASDVFLQKLSGVTNPEEKRKIIGGLFIDIFEEEAKKLGGIKFLAQGTLYPDVIESTSVTGGPSVTIKSHHNVGGLPARMNMALIEPLRELFKDEVRILGTELGIPDELVGRHPFPGPGLAIRIPGEITPERANILRKADQIYLAEIKNNGLYDKIWQAFAVLLPVRTVGVMGDHRTYEYVCALRAVTSTDGMTADYYPFDMEFLGRVSTRIVNEVEGINRVVYDITSKPPGTIEWE